MTNPSLIRLALWMATFLLLALPLNLRAEDDYRIWKDTSGRELEAAMLRVDSAAGAIQMKRRDGSEVVVPIAMLSPADLEYAKAKWQEMQGTPPTGAPTATGAAATTNPAPPRPTLEIIPADKFKLPAASDYLRNTPRTRPRLIHNEAGWAYLAQLLTTDETMGALYNALQQSGSQLLAAPELTRVYGDQNPEVNPATKAIYRFATLATLHHLDQDPAWSDRAVRELVALADPANFPDWYAEQPQVMAAFTIAVCLGYDWFHAQLNQQQVATIRGRILTQGLEPLIEALNQTTDHDGPPGVETFTVASALMLGGLCLMDEEPTLAKKAVGDAAKPFGEGFLHYARSGVWPAGPDQGDVILDYAIMVLQSLRSIAGTDFGFTLVEAVPRVGDARLHLTGPTSQTFNYGDASASAWLHPWTSSWLSGLHGNPGLPAVTAGKPQGPDTAYFGNAGYVLYQNPNAAGNGAPPAPDAVFPEAEIATLRSAWNDRNAYYIALKGGNNELRHSHLDLGDFVLDAGGQRWAIQLGAESEKAPGMTTPEDRTRRYALYTEGTPGQNTLSFGVNQDLEAQAPISGFVTTPARGAAVIDLSDAYSASAKSTLRGAMVVRTPTPYILLQDEVSVKNTSTLQWAMHTRAEVAVDGRKATLTQGKQTLTAYLVTPENAAFSVEDAPAQITPLKSLNGIRVLKTLLSGVKGDQRITVSFVLGTEPAPAPVLPLSEWTPQR